MFHPMDLKDFHENVFTILSDDWALLTAGTPDHCNTMTVGWGGFGTLWAKPVATVYIRPQRYTLEFVEREPTFTLSFFSPRWKKQLAYCGRVSGRVEDKFAACGFHMDIAGNTPYIREARLVLVCKKRYWNDLDPSHMDEEALEHYKAEDYHRMFVGEITEVLVNDEVQ